MARKQQPQPARSERDRKIEALRRQMGEMADQKTRLEDVLALVEASWHLESNKKKKALYAATSNGLLQIIGDKLAAIEYDKATLAKLAQEVPG